MHTVLDSILAAKGGAPKVSAMRRTMRPEIQSASGAKNRTTTPEGLRRPFMSSKLSRV
jgi:hypothetical protein